MILSPGATIGILGAGQLGRMLAISALKLGLRCHVYAPETDAPAHDAAMTKTIAAYEDESALAAFAEAVDVVTYEFENVPTATVEFLAARKPVRPGARALALTQDRLVEKQFLHDLGLETAPFLAVEDSGSLVRAVARRRSRGGKDAAARANGRSFRRSRRQCSGHEGLDGGEGHLYRVIGHFASGGIEHHFADQGPCRESGAIGLEAQVEKTLRQADKMGDSRGGRGPQEHHVLRADG